MSKHFTVERDVIVPMRDGTKLRADVYLPQGEGPFPTLLERTPYDKRNSAEIQLDAPQYFTTHGYAAVIQDTRGRYASEGEFYPFHDDGWGVNRDGYDTVEWCAQQPWCNGKVGTIGGSYSGMTQYRLAPTNPPHLAAVFARESSADYHAEWVYRGGAFELAFNMGWALRNTLNNLPYHADEATLNKYRGVLERAVEEIDSWQRHLPLHPFPPLAGIADWFNDWLAHPDDGAYWWQWNVETRHSEVNVPIYHLGGWFDIFLNGTLKNFIGIRQKAKTPEARRAQRLIVGPWVHGPKGIGQRVHGEVDFGEDGAQDFHALRLRWFDYWLKGSDNGVTDEPPVKLFVMGENKWRTFDDFPVPGTRCVNWYFHSGSLSPQPPTSAETPDSYLYDPDRPVPTRGGNTLSIPGGPYDQREVETLCLTYTSKPLTEDLTVIGPVKCVLYAMSSAPDTDWVVRLCDVHPDGRSMLMCDGILRARYRESFEKSSLLTPHQVYAFEVDLWSTAHCFKAGHRLRVSVTSSNFPRFDRNLNTGGAFGKEAKGQVALNTVFHDCLRPSHIVLPVVG